MPLPHNAYVRDPPAPGEAASSFGRRAPTRHNAGGTMG
jgi:hypothetical protein